MTLRTYFSFAALLLFAGVSINANAQDGSDAFRYSNLTTQGTARSMGFGNALGSVGSDFSALSVNPAGIGMYHSSELTLTPSLKMNSTSASYLGVTSNDNNATSNFNNLGAVFTRVARGRRAENTPWKAISFGIGFNRLADFNNTYSYRGTNYSSSASQSMEADANQYGDYTTSGNLGYLGYQSYLLSDPDSVTHHVSSVVPFQKGINQWRSVAETGHVNETVFSLGANYNEKLMLGATMGLPYINYQRNVSYSETLMTGQTDNFSSLNYSETLNTTGTGINLKLGAIYKITDEFRVGAAFHSPTYYSLHDEFSQSVTSNITGAPYNPNKVSNPTNTFDYNLITPWKGILSATMMINKFGFITADYEFVDYSFMKYTFPGDYLSEASNVNQTIKSDYKAASNFRIGGEGHITPNFLLRLGFGYYGNPYKTGVDATRTDISGGLGCRFNHFFADIALVHSTYKGTEQPYTLNNAYIFDAGTGATPRANLNYALNNIALTIGMRF
jgi:long-subunit fatty acid transport protein